MSGTWILFTSGQAVEIIVTRNQPAKIGGNPADVHVVTDSHKSFEESAQRAGSVFYNWAETSGRKPERFAAGIDLEGLSLGDALSGESGGVAFAVALAKSLVGHDPGPVAATGVVTARNGQIEAIKGLAAKLEGAAKILPPGGWIFYPQANLYQEIDSSELSLQIENLRLQGYRLHAVSTVAEVLAELFCAQISCAQSPALPEKSTNKYFSLLLLMSAICAVLWGVMAIKNEPPEASNASIQIVSPDASSISMTVTIPPMLTTKPQGAVVENSNNEIKQKAAWVTGSSRLESTLALQVEAVLRGFSDLLVEGPPVKIKILGLSEELLEKGMLSTLSIQVAESHLRYRGQRHDLPIYVRTLSHPGSIEQATPELARQLVEFWLLAIIQNKGGDDRRGMSLGLKETGFD